MLAREVIAFMQSHRNGLAIHCDALDRIGRCACGNEPRQSQAINVNPSVAPRTKI
jgi:hypothetical protein